MGIVRGKTEAYLAVEIFLEIFVKDFKKKWELEVRGKSLNFAGGYIAAN